MQLIGLAIGRLTKEQSAIISAVTPGNEQISPFIFTFGLRFSIGFDPWLKITKF